MIKPKGIIGLLGAAILLAGCGDEQEGEDQEAAAQEANSEDSVEEGDREDWPDELRFADTGVEGMEELQREFEPFQEELEETIGVDIEFFAVTDRTIGSTAMEYDQVDVLLAGPSEYAQVKSVVPDAELLAGIERGEYHAAFIVHEDSDIESLADVEGHSIAMKDAGSTSGHVGPSEMLIDEGMDVDEDVDIQLLDEARFDAFLNRDVEVMATGIKDYHEMVEEHGDDDFRLIAEGETLPNDVFVASPELPDDLIEHMRESMLENDEALLDSILVTGENDKYVDGTFAEAHDEDYDSMRNAYEELGLDLSED
ncbi:phosphate/phosphite/phosphonate ABC transporter substrate-binding protein [Salicibibacter kimchii]|uniref:Phosphonate ABC transporter substrate-binding protein n=1 Tax=Salicibibacter kimchii TaxID=2099786 RepID=A0A345BY80_9BACI|nr:PhnD/SsuA/transferrin family substrate-binding protein [Salicibibacter kimchii]AXF55911.1 phosphonate ABC transporter substrate-binding protein [Salicibibacter kimchii]